MASQRKTPTGLVYEVNQEISFGHRISSLPFRIISAEIKSVLNAAGKAIQYQLFGIEPYKPSDHVIGFNYLALLGLGRQFFGSTPEDARRKVLEYLVRNREF